MSRSILALVGGVALAVVSSPSSAKPKDKDAAPAASEAPPAPEDPTVLEARARYGEGVALVKQEQWSEALVKFERSAALRPHATTVFNIAACQRALGRYVLARASFESALARAQANPAELAPSLTTEAQGFVAELDGILVQLTLSVKPDGAALAVDGRPIEARGTLWVGGVAPPGKGKPAPRGTFTLVLDPGAHVFAIGRKGFADAVVNKSFAPGTHTQLALETERLPATLRVTSNVTGALVYVDDRDLGPAPVDVLRPPGAYTVRVSKDGYETYEAKVSVNAGEESKLGARLNEEHIPITKRWWFWTGAAAVVAGGAWLTYALTRPDPEPPPYDGGSTNWVVKPQGWAF